MRRDRRTFNFPLILSFVIMLHLLAIGYWLLAHLLPRLEQKKLLAAQQQTVAIPVPEVTATPPLAKAEVDRLEKEIRKDENLPALASREPALNPPSRLVIPEEPFDPDPVLPESLGRPKPAVKPRTDPRPVAKKVEPEPVPKVTPNPEPRPEVAVTPQNTKPTSKPIPRRKRRTVPEPKVADIKPAPSPKMTPEPRVVPRARLVPETPAAIVEPQPIPRARVVETIPPDRIPPPPEPAPSIVEAPVPRARVVEKPATETSTPAPAARRVGPSTPVPSPEARPSRAVMLAYQQHIVGMMKRNWQQPRGRAIPRPARVRVTILPDGTVSGARLVDSSGDRALDESALRAVSLIERVKPFPEGVDQSTYSPVINFELQ